MNVGEEIRAYEEYLVVASMAGDRRASERLAARWLPRLLRTARRLLGDASLAEDAAQDTWVGIVRSLPGLRDPTRFPAFAHRILRRRCIDAGKTRRADVARAAGSLDDPGAPSEIAALSRGAGGGAGPAILAAFASVPFEQRVAATLFFAEGLSVSEIAEASGAPVGTVKSRLFHARRKLKSTLEGELS